jgi:hypothetical protein
VSDPSDEDMNGKRTVIVDDPPEGRAQMTVTMQNAPASPITGMVDRLIRRSGTPHPVGYRPTRGPDRDAFVVHVTGRSCKSLFIGPVQRDARFEAVIRQ